jgi:hypothetical protein
MAMFCIRETIRVSCAKTLFVAVLLGSGLCGCADNNRETISPYFGQALRQDLAAQIADPDAHYRGDPAPGSNGARVALAQERYRTGKVFAPIAANASDVGAMSTTPPTGP